MSSSGDQDVLDAGSAADTPGGFRRSLWSVVAAGLVGALIAGLAVHRLDFSSTTKPTHLDVRVSLGVDAGGQAGVEQGIAIVGLPLLVRNETSQPVTLTSIQVSGPGASLTHSPGGRPSTDLPAVLPPGQFIHFEIGLGSNCSVLIRPMPVVTFNFRDSSGQAQSLIIPIPDLEYIWGQTLLPGVCPTKQT